MTTNEAAWLIGCSERHVRNLISRGRIGYDVVVVNNGRPLKRLRYDVPLEEVRRYTSLPQRQGWPRGKPRSEE